MSEGRTQTMRLAPFDAMPPAVRQRIATDRASWADRAARAHEPEPDAAQVEGDSLVIDGDADGTYRHGVDHVCQDALREAERQAFLRRVQYVDPRERRA